MSSLIYKGTIAAMRLIGFKKQFSCEEAKLLKVIQEKYRPADIPKKLYRELKVEKENFLGRPFFVLAPKSAANSTVILFLHGGGGIMGPTAFHFDMAERLIQATGCKIYFPFYPLAPEYSCAYTLKWVEQLNGELLSRHTNADFFIIGDSAGAFLSAYLCAKTGNKIRGIVMISPAAGATHDDVRMDAMEERDPMLTMHQVRIIRKHWIRNLSPDDPRINMEKTDFTKFPPIQLFYGTNEIFYPNIPPLIHHIQACGASLEVHEGKGLCHDWAVIGFLPEAKKAQKQIVTFILANREK